MSERYICEHCNKHARLDNDYHKYKNSYICQVNVWHDLNNYKGIEYDVVIDNSHQHRLSSLKECHDYVDQYNA